MLQRLWKERVNQYKAILVIKLAMKFLKHADKLTR